MYELHNIAELDELSAYPGPLIRRVPKGIAESLENGANVAEYASLCEIRFVVEKGRRLAVIVTSLNGDDLFVYCGDFVQNHIRLPAGAVYRLVLDFEHSPFAGTRPGALAESAFSPSVWRVVLDGPTLFHGIDLMGCQIRSPRADEKPKSRWLAYGSSITHGYTPVSRQQCYVAQAARRMGVDVLNLGLSGSCLCERGFIDYLTSRSDWDIMTCELGINMRDAISREEYASRIRYLINSHVTRQPRKHLVLITGFRCDSDCHAKLTSGDMNYLEFRDITRALARECRSANVHLLEGEDLLPDFAGLACDLVHPSTEGHAMIGENLAGHMRCIMR